MADKIRRHVKKMEKKRIGLYGGTFDPVHLGHIQMAHEAYLQANLDLVVFLPCHTSPHKLDKKNAAPSDRIKLLELSLANEILGTPSPSSASNKNSWAVVNDFDLTNPPPNFSYLTIQAMMRQYPNSKFFWIMGFDQWQALPTWKNPELLASLVTFLVFSRGENPLPREGFEMIHLTGTHPASASAIRKNFSAHKDWMNPAAWQYAVEKNLYP